MLVVTLLLTGAFGFEPKSPLADKVIITTTRSHMTSAVKRAIDACNPTDILQVGGAGHKVGFQLLKSIALILSLIKIFEKNS